MSSSSRNSQGSCWSSSSFDIMMFLFDDSLSFPLSSTLDIKSLNNIFFLYHALGLVPSSFRKNLLLMYMCIKSYAQSNIKWFRTLLWTNEYELQFHSHDDVEYTYQNVTGDMCKCASTNSNQVPPLMWEQVDVLH